MRLISTIRLLVEARQLHDAQGSRLSLVVLEDARVQLIQAVYLDDGRHDPRLAAVLVELMPDRAVGVMLTLGKCRGARARGAAGSAEWVVMAEAFLRLIDPTPGPSYFGT